MTLEELKCYNFGVKRPQILTRSDVVSLRLCCWSPGFYPIGKSARIRGVEPFALKEFLRDPGAVPRAAIEDQFLFAMDFQGGHPEGATATEIAKWQ